MKSDYIQLDKEVLDFEDAIRISFLPFMRFGAVTESYSREVIKIFQEIGPYIVITPHIALPHAPSSSGAKELAIGFTRLKKAVVSGNEANDPVMYLFPLSAPDSESHIQVLSELAKLLSDKEFIKKLTTVKQEQELITYIKSREEE